MLMQDVYTKKQEQQKWDTLLNDCGVFFAFSNERFDEHLKAQELKESELTSIGHGGFMPKKNVDKYITGAKEIRKWCKDSKKNDEQVILYELRNHECFYTGDYLEAMDALEHLGYTEAQVRKVYKKYHDQYA